MTLIRRTNPFGELVSLRQAMDSLFEDSSVRPRGSADSGEQPLALDIYSTDDLTSSAKTRGERQRSGEVRPS
ncbi:hypothetical protein BH24CHL5_BH24CHL5_03590 [soil metagenome]